MRSQSGPARSGCSRRNLLIAATMLGVDDPPPRTSPTSSASPGGSPQRDTSWSKPACGRAADGATSAASGAHLGRDVSG